jgi:hypothetical protein
MMIADLAGARQSESSRVKSDVHLGDSREAGVLKKAVGGGALFLRAKATRHDVACRHRDSFSLDSFDDLRPP